MSHSSLLVFLSIETRICHMSSIRRPALNFLLLISMLSCSIPARASAARSVLHRLSHTQGQHSQQRQVSAMALRYPKTIEVPAKSKTSAQGVVIMLHGLGDSGDGWRDVGPQLQQQLPGIKFVFPTAPERAVTLNNGYRMNAWYDIPTLESINSSEDKEGLLESKRYIEELVAKEVAAGTPSTRVLVGGFSQGGAVALLMLRSNVKLAGIMALSTYLPLRDEPGVLSEENKAVPIFMGHGDADRVVSYAFGKQTETRLKGFGADVDFRTYPGMAHSACAKEMQDIAAFLTKVFA